MEIHHIDQDAHGGGNDPENAMPLCFDCHAEVNHYNDDHPKGRKFTPMELRGHRDQWLLICAEHPQVFVAAVGRAQAGPLEALLDELEFNIAVARSLEPDDLGCMFLDEQFKRATESGSITLLDSDVKRAMLDAYVAMNRGNYYIRVAHSDDEEQRGRALGQAQRQIYGASKLIAAAHSSLRSYLGLTHVDVDAAPRGFKRPSTPSALEILSHLDAAIWAITVYERTHKLTPTSHHHLLKEKIAAVEDWNTRYINSPPPGIRPVQLVAVFRAWKELDEVKAQVTQSPTAVQSTGYLAGVEALHKTLNDARYAYREAVNWAGPVAI
jgi:hypothetical protein